MTSLFLVNCSIVILIFFLTAVSFPFSYFHLRFPVFLFNSKIRYVMGESACGSGLLLLIVTLLIFYVWFQLWQRQGKTGCLFLSVDWWGLSISPQNLYGWEVLLFQGSESEVIKRIPLLWSPHQPCAVTSVMMGSHGWPWKYLSFLHCRPDFQWKTLFLSWLKHCMPAVLCFHNPTHASAAWANHLQTEQTCVFAESREWRIISWLWLLPFWLMESCSHIR